MIELQNFLKQVEETKEYIGPYLNLYQVHSATFDSGILTNTDVHKALHRCREENGWKIGLSVSGPNQDDIIREALKIYVPAADASEERKQPKRRVFDSVQCTYNILEQRPATALKEAHDAGMDIIVKEGLANGRALRHPKLLELSQKMACSPDQLALGAIVAQPWKPTVLSGAVTADQLRSNFASVEERLMATSEGKEILRELMEVCRVDSEVYWKERTQLKWN